MRESKAFTLTEVLIALIILGIIVAGKVTLFSTGTTVAQRGINLNAKLTAERFSLENIQAQLRRGLLAIQVITTAEARADIPDGSSVVTIYLEDTGINEGYIILNRGGRREVLLSEKIDGLNFELPIKPAAPTASDYILSVEVTARGISRAAGAERSARRNIALLGPPAAGGIGVDTVETPLGGYAWSGPAIRLISSIEVFDLQILNQDAAVTNFPDRGNIMETLLLNPITGELEPHRKGARLLAYYKIELPEGVDVRDGSVIEWFVSNPPPSGADFNLHFRSTANRLVDTSAYPTDFWGQVHGNSELSDVYDESVHLSREYVEGDVLLTGNSGEYFRVAGNSSADLGERYVYVKYRIQPRLWIDGVLVETAPRWSPPVKFDMMHVGATVHFATDKLDDHEIATARVNLALQIEGGTQATRGARAGRGALGRVQNCGYLTQTNHGAFTSLGFFEDGITFIFERIYEDGRRRRYNIHRNPNVERDRYDNPILVRFLNEDGNPILDGAGDPIYKDRPLQPSISIYEINWGAWTFPWHAEYARIYLIDVTFRSSYWSEEEERYRTSTFFSDKLYIGEAFSIMEFRARRGIRGGKIEDTFSVEAERARENYAGGFRYVEEVYVGNFDYNFVNHCCEHMERGQQEDRDRGLPVREICTCSRNCANIHITRADIFIPRKFNSAGAVIREVIRAEAIRLVDSTSEYHLERCPDCLHRRLYGTAPAIRRFPNPPFSAGCNYTTYNFVDHDHTQNPRETFDDGFDLAGIKAWYTLPQPRP